MSSCATTVAFLFWLNVHSTLVAREVVGDHVRAWCRGEERGRDPGIVEQVNLPATTKAPGPIVATRERAGVFDLADEFKYELSTVRRRQLEPRREIADDPLAAVSDIKVECADDNFGDHREVVDSVRRR